MIAFSKVKNVTFTEPRHLDNNGSWTNEIVIKCDDKTFHIDLFADNQSNLKAEPNDIQSLREIIDRMLDKEISVSEAQEVVCLN